MMREPKAIRDNVFIKPDPKNTKWEDINLSEKLLVRNQVGVVTSTGSNKYVTIGDRVHIPAYDVHDFEFDGVEYAVTKDGDLFAKEVNGVFSPINRYVKVIKCVNDHVRDESGDVLLHMTDTNLEFTEWVEITAVAEDCDYIKPEHVGRFFIAPESDNRLQRLLYSKEYMVHEDLIKSLVDGENMIKPIGNCVILELDDDGVEKEFGVWTNNPTYKVVSFGTGLKTTAGIILPVDLSIGSRVVVKSEEMTEMDFEEKTYYITDDNNICIEIGD